VQVNAGFSFCFFFCLHAFFGASGKSWFRINIRNKLLLRVVNCNCFSPQLVLSVGFEAMASSTAEMNGIIVIL